MKLISISCVAALVPFLILYLIPQLIWGQSALPSDFTILLVVFIPLGLGYAIVTQRLMDIDVVIRRGVVYGIITVIISVIVSIAIFSSTFAGALNIPEKLLIALILGAAATALFGPVKRSIEVMLDKYFFKDRYDYRQIIHSLSISLNSVRNLSDFSRTIVGTAVHTLNLAGGCLFIKSQTGLFDVCAAEGTFADAENQRYLLELILKRNPESEFPNYLTDAESDVAFLIPLKAGEKEVGILFLSAKNSRQDYSSGDIYLLQGVASVAAMALHSTLLIRDVNLRDTFVSIASHELRTPLTSIVGYADLLLNRNPPDDTRKRWVTAILENGKRITGMVDDLLNITRIQSGKVTLKIEKAKLSLAILERLNMAKESTTKHEFSIKISPDLPDVLIDRDKFGQVIGNLLSNAIKYSPNGGCIQLSATYESQKQRVVLDVTDEGIGISPEDQSSLFSTFHRIQRPETVGIKGSGLGLYIAKEWMEAMGGEIWLRSEFNKGSTFSLAIPVRDSDA